MGMATIILSDDAGTVACKATFDGGWNPASHAHQHANLLLKHMDELCTRASEPEIQAAEVKEARIVVVGG
jgi:hypothetical protein